MRVENWEDRYGNENNFGEYDGMNQYGLTSRGRIFPRFFTQKKFWSSTSSRRAPAAKRKERRSKLPNSIKMNELKMNYGSSNDETSDSGSDDTPDHKGTRRSPTTSPVTSRTGAVASRIYGSFAGSGASSSMSSDSASGSASGSASASTSSAVGRESTRAFVHRISHCCMRLTDDERKLLAVLENALEVCEYTDVVDVTFSHTRKSKQSRIIESLIDILSISCGLLMSNNLNKGEALLAGKTLNDNVPLFAEIFEIGRRYKIMNPNKVYLLHLRPCYRPIYNLYIYNLTDLLPHTCL